MYCLLTECGSGPTTASRSPAEARQSAGAIENSQLLPNASMIERLGAWTASAAARCGKTVHVPEQRDVGECSEGLDRRYVAADVSPSVRWLAVRSARAAAPMASQRSGRGKCRRRLQWGIARENLRWPSAEAVPNRTPFDVSRLHQEHAIWFIIPRVRMAGHGQRSVENLKSTCSRG